MKCIERDQADGHLHICTTALLFVFQSWVVAVGVEMLCARDTWVLIYVTAHQNVLLVDMLRILISILLGGLLVYCKLLLWCCCPSRSRDRLLWHQIENRHIPSTSFLRRGSDSISAVNKRPFLRVVGTIVNGRQDWALLLLQPLVCNGPYCDQSSQACALGIFVF